MDGVMLDNCPINPDLPDGFWFTPNAQRSADHMAWWDKPFIVTTANPHFPTGTRYDVYCLDGESSDRPTAWGKFGSNEAQLGADFVQMIAEGLARFGSSSAPARTMI